MKNLFQFNQYILESNNIGDFAEKFLTKLDNFKITKIPFKNNVEGNKFREWVNAEYKDYAKKIDLSKSSSAADGYKNDYILRAWIEKGKEYK